MESSVQDSDDIKELIVNLEQAFKDKNYDEYISLIQNIF